jgi:hypothetical protein
MFLPALAVEVAGSLGTIGSMAITQEATRC